MQAFFNRRFILEKQVRISAFDRGFLYGDGLFETMRIYGGRFFWLDQHLGRLFRGLKKLGIKIPYNRVELEFFLRELVLRNGVRNGFARIVVTRGEGLLGYSPRGAGTPQIIMVARSRNLGVWQRKNLVWRLCIHPEPVDGTGFKSLSELRHVIAKQEAEKKGFQDAVLLTTKREVMESTGSNLFITGEGTLWTPPLATGCLEGVTRKALLQVAKAAGVRVVEKPMPVSALRKASEIFLTNSLKEVVPCVLSRNVSSRVPVYTLAWQEKFEQFRDRHLV